VDVREEAGRIVIEPVWQKAYDLTKLLKGITWSFQSGCDGGGSVFSGPTQVCITLGIDRPVLRQDMRGRARLWVGWACAARLVSQYDLIAIEPPAWDYSDTGSHLPRRRASSTGRCNTILV
jgi:hypothetical protein